MPTHARPNHSCSHYGRVAEFGNLVEAAGRVVGNRETFANPIPFARGFRISGRVSQNLGSFQRPARRRPGYELHRRIDSSLSRVLGKATAAPEASEPPG
jgi:hypothetical protein